MYSKIEYPRNQLPAPLMFSKIRDDEHWISGGYEHTRARNYENSAWHPIFNFSVSSLWSGRRFTSREIPKAQDFKRGRGEGNRSQWLVVLQDDSKSRVKRRWTSLLQRQERRLRRRQQREQAKSTFRGDGRRRLKMNWLLLRNLDWRLHCRWEIAQKWKSSPCALVFSLDDPTISNQGALKYHDCIILKRA